MHNSRRLNIFLNSIVENIPDMVFLKDAAELRFVLFNKAGERLLGYSRKAMLGKNDYDFFPKKQADFFTEKDRQVLAGKKIIDIPEEPIQTKKGTRILHTKKVPILDEKGRPLYLLGISEDITEYKKASTEIENLRKTEHGLRESKTSLETAIAENKKDLSAAMRDLEAARRLADIGTLSASIAHELRNPLGVIKTAIYNISQKAKGRYSKEFKSHIDNIEKKIYESDYIISNLLNYSRVMSPCFEKVLISDVIKECEQDFRLKYSKFNVKLKVDIACLKGVRIKADRVQMISLLSNLLNNAYQSIPEKGGKVELTARRLAVRKSIKITVRDNGIGMSKEEFLNALEPFFSNKARGIGLGLTVCRQIAMLHKGSLDIAGNSLKGTAIVITLPA